MSEQEQRTDETPLSEEWPTPWHVHRDTNVVADDFPENGDSAVIVEATPTVDHARLIAAAPELRDAHEGNLDNIREAKSTLNEMLGSTEAPDKDDVRGVREVLDVLESRTLDALEGLT